MNDLANTLSSLTSSAADVASLFTGKPAKPTKPTQPTQPGSGLPKWLLPAGLALAAVLVVVMLLRK